jgi:hypothetical protein
VCQGTPGTPRRAAYDGSCMKKYSFYFLLWFVFIIFIIINYHPKNSRILNKIHTSNHTDNNKVIILVHDLSMIKINYNNIENVDAKNLISVFTKMAPMVVDNNIITYNHADFK